MKFLFGNEWFVIPLLAVAVFILAYNTSDRIIDFLKARSLGQKDEVLRYLKLMSADVNEKKLTLLMLSISFGLGSLFFILFWPKVLIGLLFGVTVTVVGWSIPLLVVKNIYERRCRNFTDQMVDGLTIMANGIKSGSSAAQAMSRVVEIMANPISQEFQIVLNQVQFGLSFEQALNELGERIPKPDVQMFVTAINILKETGGNLAETFQTIVVVIRERQKVEKKIEAMTAQGLMQGLIVSLVPFVLAGIFFVVDPNFIMPMFTTTLGLFLCFVVLTLQIIGGIVIKKIVTIKV
jgi:tight adherence protein B